uniref:Ras-GEF domain-containing protein n=1 Tax=Macrostomum lignano TaxID=282301 RepID=A0A1I8FK70_9PLAT
LPGVAETGGGGGGSGGGGFLHVKPELDKLRQDQHRHDAPGGQSGVRCSCAASGPSGVGGGGDGGGASSSSGADGGGGVDPYGATHRTGSLDAGACERLAAHHRSAPTYTAARLQPPPAVRASYGGATSGDPARRSTGDPAGAVRDNGGGQSGGQGGESCQELSPPSRRQGRRWLGWRPSPPARRCLTRPRAEQPESDSSGSEAAAEIATCRRRRQKPCRSSSRSNLRCHREVCDSSSPPSPQRQPPASPTIRRPTKFDVPSMRIPESQLLDHTSLSPGARRSPSTAWPAPATAPATWRRATSPTVAERRNRWRGRQHRFSARRRDVADLAQRQLADCQSVAVPRAPWLRRTSCAADSTAGDLSAGAPAAAGPSLARSSDVDSPPCRAKAGAVVTSSRASKRRSSNTAAALAFSPRPLQARPRCRSRESEVQMPQLMQHRPQREQQHHGQTTEHHMYGRHNAVRHWVYKFGEDIESDPTLRADMIDLLLEDLVCNQNLFPARSQGRSADSAQASRGATGRGRQRFGENPHSGLAAFTLSALDIAEQITLIDHKLFRALKSAELITQAWMKKNPEDRASSTVLQISKRFNATSCLVVSEIISCSDIDRRVTCIEKWAAIADILPLPAQLQRRAADLRSFEDLGAAVEITRQMIDRLQLLVSSDGRFKNMRSALHNCDPPCIPYLGMYLTDLSFIEEGTSNVTEEGLITLLQDAYDCSYLYEKFNSFNKLRIGLNTIKG